MLYKMAVISCIETDTAKRIILATFYPSADVCIHPRPYERIVSSCIRGIELEMEESLSSKGRQRLKLVMSGRPQQDEDERRALGTTYFSTLFGPGSGTSDERKGIADTLYDMMVDLYFSEAGSEEAWGAAADKALATLGKAAQRQR